MKGSLIVAGLGTLLVAGIAISAAKAFGLRFPVLIGVTAMLFVELVLVAGAWLAHCSYADESGQALAVNGSRWIFGLGGLAFGLAHLTSIKFVAAMIPNWMPLGGPFWVVLTGIAFLLAGAAILARIHDVLAARMLALMLLIFSVVLLTPGIFAQPHSHVAWGSNAVNLTATASAFLFSEGLAARKRVAASPSAAHGTNSAAA